MGKCTNSLVSLPNPLKDATIRLCSTFPGTVDPRDDTVFQNMNRDRGLTCRHQNKKLERMQAAALQYLICRTEGIWPTNWHWAGLQTVNLQTSSNVGSLKLIFVTEYALLSFPKMKVEQTTKLPQATLYFILRLVQRF